MVIYRNGMESSRAREIFSVEFLRRMEIFFFLILMINFSGSVLLVVWCQRFVGQLFLCEGVRCLSETSQEFQKDPQFYYYYICFPNMIVYILYIYSFFIIIL